MQHIFQRLETDVNRFRKALECTKRDLGVVFENFPLGSCGVASELLAAYLKDMDYGTFEYVSGWNKTHENSHAWLENKDCLIDITGDQFAERNSLPFVVEDKSWHRERFSHNVERYDDADFRNVNNSFENLQNYPIILDFLNKF